ncbi:MAG TPA: gliding motility-associated C-terminal domain-containing protein [Ohtaekwangia sp.]
MKGAVYLFSSLRLLLIGLFLVAGLTEAAATHLRAGNIFVTRVGDCSSRTYRIRVIVYTNTNNTSVLFGGDQDYLDLGDGSPRILVPEIGPGHPNYEVIDASRGIATAFFEITYTYGGSDEYTISYIEPNRNTGVLNMEKSENTTFYLETKILIDSFLGCSTPPTLDNPPIDRACSGAAWSHNPGANDPDDSISYQMVVPFQKRNTEVVNYAPPNAPQFYTNYEQGNEAGTGPPTFSIDNEGTITWDAPGAPGEYNIAFIVIEWREVRGVRYPIGFVRRDMQIIVEDDCNNERPDLEVPDKVCVVAGETITETIMGSDPDGDQVKIEAISPIFDFATNAATLSPPPGYRPSPDVVEFEWTTTCEHVKEQPYQVLFKITDRKPGGGLGLAYYKTWLIYVVGPPPTWEDATLNLSQRSATIRWDPYICQQADSIQIWRKVDGSDFVPDTCNTGMPESLGYQKIATSLVKKPDPNDPTVIIPVVEYVDKNGGQGLAPGAVYCYRLVAVYSTRRGGESLVSLDTCVGPILADVPIVTKVSIQKTSETDGAIKVEWFRPYEADAGQFPPPYTYVVFRGGGFTRGNDSTEVEIKGPSTADTLSITDIGLNTRDNVFNYTVLAIAADGDTLGSSAPASSVRLESRSELKKITLNWRAAVPWSNQITNYKHKVFRGPEGSTEVDLELIAEVDVTTDGLTYVDVGQHNNIPLEDDTEYCYRVETYGSYGNEDIYPDTLKNFSQIICVLPGDTISPCKPILEINLVSCEDALQTNTCGQEQFTNTLTWINLAGPECQADISSYRIYIATSMDGEYTYYRTVPGTNGGFLDTELRSYARCYKVSAVDRSGNESELSNAVCNDNCPQYVLPNVFTPNGDEVNDFFSAFSLRGINCVDQSCPPYLIEACARFVEKVEFKVYNRWGQELYTYESGSENSIYIDWNGRDKNGTFLDPAVYYYIAEVTFITIDPNKRHKTLKGWVHLLK